MSLAENMGKDPVQTDLKDTKAATVQHQRCCQNEDTMGLLITT